MDFDVPIVVSSLNQDDEHWDLTTRHVILFLVHWTLLSVVLFPLLNQYGLQVAQFIDGVNHISRIAELSKLDLEMVTACVQNLV